MTLSDPKYLVFLLLVFAAFRLLRGGGPRLLLLLGASYFFYYQLSHEAILILLLVTALTFLGGLALRTPQIQGRGPLWALLSIGVVLTPLLLYKYAPRASASFLTSAVLPIGISFFTFTAIGYLSDVYLEIIEPEANPMRLALFLALFCNVSAGPIERGSSLLPQLDLHAPFSANDFLEGLKKIFWGLILKIVFAGTLEGPVNAFFAAPQTATPLEQAAAMIHYSFYLYADFAGYSLIAIGSARLLGLQIRPNFQQPFLSSTIAEFWRHWHMSLSSWVRDYIFSPLRIAWRRAGNFGMAAALFLSLVILGIWHGGSHLGYLVFGVTHGILLTASTLTLPKRNAFWLRFGITPRMTLFPRTVLTFLIVTLTFVAFRARNMFDAGDIYQNLFSLRLIAELLHEIGLLFSSVPLSTPFHFIQGTETWILILILIGGDLLVRNKKPLDSFPLPVRMVVYQIGVATLIYHWLYDNAPALFQYYKF